ncbi:MAG: copper amine oxidase N-terminal domain-containing protein [Bacillota bacterium]
MRRSGIRWVTGWVLLALLVALVPASAGAEGEWERVGRKVWLAVGEGIDLSTGGAGEDLLFEGETLSAPNGMQILHESDYIDYDLVAPRTGYTTSLKTAEVAYTRVVVRLAGGSSAQVRIGMASISGLAYSGLFLEEWVVQQGSGEAEPVLRGEIKLKLNSREAVGNGLPATLDVPPQEVNGQVMLPLRYVGETLGLRMKWDGREQKVTISGEDLSATLWVGKRSAQINGKTVTLPQAPTIRKQRLLIPMLVAGEALAGKASYDAATGVITLGGSSPASPSSTGSDTAPTGSFPAHFSATWLNGYKDGWISDAAGARPDFYLTLNADGTARVILTITGMIGAAGYPVNLEYLGTYTRDPFQAQLSLQPAVHGWETLEHSMPYWQELFVTGDLAADLSKIENLSVNDQSAKSGSAIPAKRVPEPGEWR